MIPPRHPGTVCEFEPYDTLNATGEGGVVSECDLLSAGFRWTVLERHGKRPLAILGRVLLQANNRCSGLPCWSEIAIHETIARRFTASVSHRPPEAFDVIWRNTWLCETPKAIVAALQAHDPLHTLSPGVTTRRPLPVALDDFPAFNAGGYQDEAAVRRFRGAWAGLLAAIFGLRSTLRPAE